MNQAARGAAALSAGEYAEAVKQYTAALQTNPMAVDYYIKRSTAYQRSSPANYNSALSDAEKAAVLAHKRGKRELIAQAQLRRGIALFGLELWADAGFCFDIVRKLNKDEKSLTIWDSKVKSKLAGLPEDDEKRHATCLEVPDISIDAPSNDVKEIPSSKMLEDNATSGSTSVNISSGAGPSQQENKPEGVTTPASKIRHDWYQTNDSVTVTLLAKGVPKDKAVVDIQARSLTISFPLPGSSTYDLSLDPLFAPIDPATSSYKIMSTKVEIILKKAAPGHKWHSLDSSTLDRSADITLPTRPSPGKPASGAASAPQSTVPSLGPSYPTSSRSGPKDWDKVAAELSKKPKKSESSENTKDNKEAEDELDDDDGGDPVNAFFKKIYASADPDTRRAMMKSYQESNGTALSTNWAEVGKKKVETSPPDGMIAKKWGE
ncbi:SGS-domain-containing protein [Xylona heveae TC161]|uniref:SGS-domain-containing protein n=1 Tax=Xylona heveae (strain CBS 132557 / TC161) TaxID=1328760 RepID=A0A165ACC4_XYLHT|nr:SGS-domain-containing protein [Xylona heveae TC161]KZF20246.1 SGS-domain-containing protein [Xylona heveae TC161]